MEERTAFFQSEVTVDAAYLRRTWSNYGKLARARWILALFPLVCIVYLAAQHARGGYTSLGIFVPGGDFAAVRRRPAAAGGGTDAGGLQDSTAPTASGG